jgi:hypothetical protein
MKGTCPHGQAAPREATCEIGYGEEIAWSKKSGIQVL